LVGSEITNDHVAFYSLFTIPVSYFTGRVSYYIRVCLATFVIFDHVTVTATFLCLGIVKEEWRCLGIILTALWVVCTAASGWAVGWVIFGIPHGESVGGRPEHVIFVREHMSLGLMLTSEFGVAFTQSAVTGTGIIFADGVSIFISIFVSDEFSDAHIAKFHSCTFDTVLVCFADCIEGVDWWTVAWIRHWSVAKDETVASISPVFSFVKVGVVMTHHVG
jgi:hypothetical protein